MRDYPCGRPFPSVRSTRGRPGPSTSEKPAGPWSISPAAPAPTRGTLFGIELAVSEACTNAIVHGYADGPAEIFTVEAELLGEELCVIVRDRGRGMVPRPDSPGLGLGLPLISQMADRVEVRSPPEGDGGVELCMIFSLAGAAEAA